MSDSTDFDPNDPPALVDPPTDSDGTVIAAPPVEHDVDPVTDGHEPAPDETQGLPAVDTFRAVRKLTAAEVESPGALDNAKSSAYREAVMLATHEGAREMPLNNSIDELATPDGVGGMTIEVTITCDIE